MAKAAINKINLKDKLIENTLVLNSLNEDKFKDLPIEKGTVVEHRDGTIGVYVKDPFGNYLEYIWYSDEQKEVFVDG